VCLQLGLVATQHRQIELPQVHRFDTASLAIAVRGVDQQGILPARHVDVDIGQKLGVQQGAVQGASRVVHAKPVTERIQTVALAREHLLGHDQAVDHARHHAGDRRTPQQLQFLVQETDVEGRVVDDEFRALEIGQQLVGDLRELGLVAQKLVADAVHLERVLVAVALRVDVVVQVVAGELACQQLDTADLDDAIAVLGR